MTGQLGLFQETPEPQAPAATDARPGTGASGQGRAVVLPEGVKARELVLGQTRVAYLLRRGKRGSVGLSIRPEGLCVAAPKWATVESIEQVLQGKADWILRKLGEHQQRQQKLAAAKIEWADGVVLPFLGELVQIRLDPKAAGAVLHTLEGELPGLHRLTLVVGLPQTASTAQIRDAVQSWLQRQAKRVFEARCSHYAELLGVRMTRLSLSSAQTRWGSASASGHIRLNWRLVHFAMSTIDYVVAHELAHLREMNHSPRFWDVVRTVVPDYEAARGALREDLLPQYD